MTTHHSFLGRATPFRVGRLIAAHLPPWPQVRGIVIAVSLMLVLAGSIGSAGLAALAWRDNRTVVGLAAGRDLPVDARSRAEVVFARAGFLLARERIDEAQALVLQVKAAGDPRLLADLQYNIANARLRAAVGLIEQNRIDPAIPLVRLAKDGYRAALVLAPDHWDARYNLDVAMRLVRDFPQIGQDQEEETPPEAPKQLWTDLPGLPKGLP